MHVGGLSRERPPLLMLGGDPPNPPFFFLLRGLCPLRLPHYWGGDFLPPQTPPLYITEGPRGPSVIVLYVREWFLRGPFRGPYKTLSHITSTSRRALEGSSRVYSRGSSRTLYYSVIVGLEAHNNTVNTGPRGPVFTIGYHLDTFFYWGAPPPKPPVI